MPVVRPEAPAFGEFAIAERPAQQLEGLSWEGSHEEAMAGAVRTLLKRVQAGFARAETSLWAGPIVAISWNTGPGRFRTFAGVEAGGDAAAGLETLSLPAQKFAATWHAAEDGDVVERYGRMIEWIRSVGHARSPDGPHHREEYPRDGDFDGPPVLRLMLPVA